MTEEQITAKIMKINSDLGLIGHQTTQRIVDRMFNVMAPTDWFELYEKYRQPWGFGDQTHINLITEIERILTEKGILS